MSLDLAMVLRYDTKAQRMKEKIGNLDFKKMKNYCA